MRTLTWWAGAVLLLSIELAAQIGGSGTIKGTVVDATGAVVPGASVTATHGATGVETKRETTAAGLFVIAPLPAGVYTLTAAAPAGLCSSRFRSRPFWPMRASAVFSSGEGCRCPSTGAAAPTSGRWKNPAFTGDVRINGEWGSGDLLGARPAFLDARAFRSPVPYTYGDTPGAGAFGLYSPGFWNEDLGVTRQFGITERFKVDFSAEAFNVTNAVAFNGPASLDITNANFGRITGQQNSPRSLQLALKLHF